MSGRDANRGARDQDATPFGVTLERFCATTSALGAALVDVQGETVDYAGRLAPYETRVTAAEWRLVLEILRDCPAFDWARTSELTVRCRRASYLAIPLAEGYALVARLAVHSTRVSRRAATEAVRELCREGGLVVPGVWTKARWLRVEVQSDPRPSWRPLALRRDAGWFPLEILGRYPAAALGRREIGFRARLEVGADLTLVREPLGIWYADGLPDV